MKESMQSSVNISDKLNSNFDKHSFSEKLAKAMAVNNPYGKRQGADGRRHNRSCQAQEAV